MDTYSFNKLDFQETIHGSQLLISINYQTLTYYSTVSTFPSSLLSAPGVNDTLEISALTNTKTLYLNGNSISINDIPFV